MASRQQSVRVDGRRLRVTSLDKVLYPESGTTKAEVLEYYQAAAPAMLPLLAGRPVTRKRWPDGTGSGDFFRKNLEDSAPGWVPVAEVQHSDHVNTYPLADSAAVLAWFGQVAALELHVPQWRVDPGAGRPQPPGSVNPDRLVLDLDPGPGTALADCAQAARWCRELLDSMGLPSVPVTSGSKGIHLYAALDGSYTSEQVSEVAKELAKALEKDHPDDIVSDMSKDRRRGKVLIDWSQNSANKTTVAPYSLRGRNRPWVAVPRTWDELEDADSLEHLDFRQVMERLAEGTDPLAGFGGSPDGPAEDALSTYRAKRDAGRTLEPVPETSPSLRAGDPLFVIQEHHARRLHFDTRVEHNGVLVSWAVPKAPPLKQGAQRLAVRTEDHPVEYAEFEGTIPKGEYGAGEVTIWDHGTAQIEKWEPEKVVVVLHGRPGGGLDGIPRRYALVKTGKGTEKDQWLIRLTKNQPKAQSRPDDAGTAPGTAKAPGTAAALPHPLPSPMLATLGKPSDIRGDGWAFEAKWDGYRAIAAADDSGTVHLRSRSGRDLTDTFPELTELAEAVPAGTVLDGEVVALNSQHRPDFGRLQQRGRLTKPREIERAAKRIPVHFMAFDLLHTAEHGDLTGEPYARRRELLAEVLSPTKRIQRPDDLGQELEHAMEVSQKLQLEGVMAKRTSDAYHPGRRSEGWVKLKQAQHADVVVVGYRRGNGGRAKTFSSLLLAAENDGGELTYAGRVGTGFSDSQLKALRKKLDRLSRKSPPVDDVPAEDASDAVWATPKLKAEVAHSGVTRDSRLRHATWRRELK
ncbi:ATP-dependent DNA ligase [Nesterenkonia populi]|uniref:ATP-dependent DNA ligase n=1 Tax=Nesterenkonia populi TaxID=1591087 RepID=UPI0011BEA897|nr:ATP-dependent DNA ligase [Nesterenkonia populi]